MKEKQTTTFIEFAMESIPQVKMVPTPLLLVMKIFKTEFEIKPLFNFER